MEIFPRARHPGMPGPPQRMAAPRVGGDSVQVLRGFDLTVEEIGALVASGTVRVAGSG